MESLLAEKKTLLWLMTPHMHMKDERAGGLGAWGSWAPHGTKAECDQK